MNVLGLIFSLLLILSYAFFACWEKQIGAHRLQRTYLGHQKVNRKILNHYESELYNKLGGKRKSSVSTLSNKKKTPQKKEGPKLNQECARLNLWPLIQEGREAHPLLYELTAKLLATFYKPLFEKKTRFEYYFLDQLLLLAKLQKESPFVLEKISFPDSLQPLYYKMLKGTKEWDLMAGVGYPSLLDYIKVDPVNEKLCLFHAHPDMLTVLFGSKAALKLHAEIHKKPHPPVTQEWIEHLCSEAHLVSLDPDLYALLKFGHLNHKLTKLTFIEKDPRTHISLRKKVDFKG
ncbi:MAG TPA: hypothetical protein VLE89_08975 [Chlamydiales bacterium]|nr:hypothetical protein [Chlamydiales bacterium]